MRVGFYLYFIITCFEKRKIEENGRYIYIYADVLKIINITYEERSVRAFALFIPVEFRNPKKPLSSSPRLN